MRFVIAAFLPEIFGVRWRERGSGIFGAAW